MKLHILQIEFMIIVFGASSALAKETVELISRDDDVIATFNNTSVTFEYDGVITQKLDLQDFDAVKKMCADIAKNRSKITFINFASISVDSLFVQLGLDAWQKMVDVNVTSTIVALQQLLRKMISDSWGRIILISSHVADTGAIGAAGYAATKSALEGLNKTLSKEYGRYNITCNLLKLGYFDVGMIKSVPPKHLEEIRRRIPSGNLGKAGEVANAIRFLMSSQYVNGTSLVINGGI